ncbi:integrator complex subunit 6-like [Zalophus californianus]|uniref:Integrator complex subunit 6-like n=2 Tax=Zalophus californianus TaxID=9704 RepID=A0A6P9FHP8_ZALCA|nr:integrator complex subunit 6-like [Zalophus californianus]
MSDKAEESAAGPKGQVRRPGKPITPPPFKKRLSMPLPSVREEGDGASQPEGSAISWEDDDPQDTAMYVSGDVPDKLPIPAEINMEIKVQLKKEIRYFEGNPTLVDMFGCLNVSMGSTEHERILKLLEGVQGPPEVQKKFVVYAMKEAARLKREDLISHLEKVLEKIEYDQFLNKGILRPSEVGERPIETFWHSCAQRGTQLSLLSLG